MSTRNPLPIALMIAAIAVGGCNEAKEPEAFTITLQAHLDESGEPEFVDHHEDVAIFPGETVSWACDCPDIDSFAVQDVEHLASIEELVDLYMRIESQGGVAGMRERSTTMLRLFEGEGEATPAQIEAVAAMMETYNGLLDGLEATMRADPGQAFEKATPGELVPADRTIESAPYRDIAGNHIWKFSWVIAKGDQEKRWDPHFSGHRRRK